MAKEKLEGGQLLARALGVSWFAPAGPGTGLVGVGRGQG